MKLLIATGIFPPQIGGPATYSKLLYDELPKRGVQVEVANFGDHLDKPKLVRHFLYFLELLRKAPEADIVYAQDPVSAGLPALLASQICRKKFMIRIAGDYAWEQSVQRFGVTDSIDEFQNKTHGIRTELLKRVQSFVASGAHTVITPSVYFKELVAKWCNDPEKVKVIYNGIETFDDIPTKTEARKTVGISRLDKVVVSSGRLVPWKGFELLIKIIAEWKKEGRAGKLYIIGDGPDRKKLEALVVSEGLAIGTKGKEGDVVFTGSVERGDMMRYIVSADLFVLNTGFESFSFQIVESMRAGTPVVSTSVGSIPELIESGREGILVPFNHHDELRRAMENVMSFVTLRKEFIKHAKKKSNMFSIDATIDSLIKLL